MGSFSAVPNWEHLHLIRSDFWFSDGNIILLAGNAAFKVHRGQLERQSEVFRDLFSIPQPPDQDLIDGCCWVELHDRPADVFYFLGALYDGLYFKSPRSNDFACVSAVLRLSTKYLVESLRSRCLARLELDWPTSLAGWDQREREAVDDKGRYLPREVCCHPILVMELAIELGVGQFLPAAFYDLSRYGPSKIMAGTVAVASALDVAAARPLPSGVANGSAGGGGNGSETGGGGNGSGSGTGTGTVNVHAFGSNAKREAALASVEASRERVVVLNKEMLVRTFKGREAAQRYISDFVARELENRSPSPECSGVGSLGFGHGYAGSTSTANPTNPTLSANTANNNTNTTVGTANNQNNAAQAVVEHPSKNCLESFYFIMLNILRSVGGIACGRDADPLFTLTQASEMLSRTDFSDGTSGGRTTGLRMCGACKSEFRKSVGRAREEVWDYLPVWFGLSVGGGGEKEKV